MKPRFALSGNWVMGVLPLAAAIVLCSCQGVQAGTTSAMSESTPTVTKSTAPERLDFEGYDKALTEISKDMDSANNALDQSEKGFETEAAKNPAEALQKFSKVFHTYGDAMDAVTKRVTALNPPTDLEKVNKALSDGTGQLAALSNKCAEAMEKKDQKALASAMQELSKFQTEFPQNLNNAVKEAGYKFDAEGNLVKA